MPFSTAWDNLILDVFTGKTASLAKPTAFYLALSTTTPTKAGGNVTEPSGNGYARVQVTAAQFDSAASSATTTNVEKAFPQATGSWGTITHAVFYDAAAAGTFLGFKALTVSLAVAATDVFRIPAGDLDLAIGGS